MKNANSVWLNGRPLDNDMAQALVRPVRVENDANCLAVSEAMDGAGAGAAVVWAVILGTGAGSGIAVQRPPLLGGTGSPASGATIRCLGHATRSGPVLNVTAAGRDALKRSCREPALRPITGVEAARHSQPRRSCAHMRAGEAEREADL